MWGKECMVKFERESRFAFARYSILHTCLLVFELKNGVEICSERSVPEKKEICAQRSSDSASWIF